MELIFVLVLVSLVWLFPAAYLAFEVWRSGDFSQCTKNKVHFPAVAAADSGLGYCLVHLPLRKA